MATEKPHCIGRAMLVFLAGAAVGAVMVALATPKSGPEWRGHLKSLARRAKRRAGDLVEDASAAWDEVKSRTVQATNDLKRGVADSMNDLRGGPSGALPAPSRPNQSEVIK